MASVYSLLLGIKIDVVLIVDSKSLWDSTLTCHEPADKSIRPHASLLRYDLKGNLLS